MLKILRHSLCCALFGSMVFDLPAQFVSYFDHSRGVGTHQYTLSFFANTNRSSGLFTNAADGVTTPVVLIATTNGTGTAISTGGSAAEPAAGTPAYNTFNGFVYFGTTNMAAIQVPVNSFHIYTFSNLNPNARYNFKGTAVRGGTGGSYSNRWTKVTIVGADAATPNHTANAVTTTQAPADLGANDVAFNFGVNNLAGQGDMAVWENIDPGPDGIFQIISTRYTGAVPSPNSTTLNNPPYGYAISGIRLEEVNATVTPIVITNGPTPASLTVQQGNSAAFRVDVSGTSPRYQWYREDGQPIVGAVNTNTSVLTFTNAQPGDSASYRVRITNSISTVVSDPASLVVEPDTFPPVIVSALALADGSNFVIHFSETLDPSALNGQDFDIHLTSGGGELAVRSLVHSNGTNVVITTDGARTARGNYSVTVQPNAVFDANGNAFAGETVPWRMEAALLSFSNTSWRYNADGQDLGIDWYDPLYDDSTWPEGNSVFDGKVPQPPGRTTVTGLPVATQLTLTNGLYPTEAGVIPTYYFRTHFSLPTTPDHIMSLKLRTIVDDFEVLYLNGQKAHQNSGYPATTQPPFFGYSGGTAVNAPLLGPFDLNVGTLATGNNVAAVIVNQVSAGSSDVTFAYELVATVDRFVDAGPSLTLIRDAGTGAVTITWPSGSGAQLFQAASIDVGTTGWTLVAGASDGSYTYTPPATGGAQTFFTLRR